MSWDGSRGGTPNAGEVQLHLEIYGRPSSRRKQCPHPVVLGIFPATRKWSLTRAWLCLFMDTEMYISHGVYTP